METSHAGDQFVEVAFAEGMPFEHRRLDGWVGRLDQALEHGDFGGINSFNFPFGEAPQEKVHLFRAAMRRPPQGPAAAHAKIVAGHDKSFLCRKRWVRASAPSRQAFATHAEAARF